MRRDLLVLTFCFFCAFRALWALVCGHGPEQPQRVKTQRSMYPSVVADSRDAEPIRTTSPVTCRERVE